MIRCTNNGRLRPSKILSKRLYAICQASNIETLFGLSYRYETPIKPHGLSSMAQIAQSVTVYLGLLRQSPSGRRRPTGISPLSLQDSPDGLPSLYALSLQGSRDTLEMVLTSLPCAHPVAFVHCLSI